VPDTYRPIKELLNKWNQPSIAASLKDINCHLISEIFGMLPNTHSLERGDEELGTINSLWLGLIPQFLDNLMNNCCKNLDETFYPKSTRYGIQMELTALWQEIKTLSMSKAAGLHKIIGTTGKKFEKELLIKYRSQIPLETLDTPNSTTTQPYQTIKKRKRDESGSSKLHIDKCETRKFIKHGTFKLNMETQPCEGLTCGREALFWCQGCNFSSNQIKSTIKQCHRCGTYMTALKRIQHILISLQIIMQQKSSNSVTITQTHYLTNIVHS